MKKAIVLFVFLLNLQVVSDTNGLSLSFCSVFAQQWGAEQEDDDDDPWFHDENPDGYDVEGYMEGDEFIITCMNTCMWCGAEYPCGELDEHESLCYQELFGNLYEEYPEDDFPEDDPFNTDNPDDSEDNSYNCIDDDNSGNHGSRYPLSQIIEWASSTTALRNIFNKLSSEGRIIETDSLYNIDLRNPKYSEDEHCIYVPINTTYTASSLIHEAIHYIQDELGILNYFSCSSNNEYQAYVVNYIFHIPYGDIITAPKGSENEDIWDEFIKSIKDHCGIINGNLWYDSNMINTIEELNHHLLNNSFRNYYRSSNNVGYYEYYDPNYDWNWETILNSLGFIKKEE